MADKPESYLKIRTANPILIVGAEQEYMLMEMGLENVAKDLWSEKP